jgi:TolB-like protein
VRISVQEKSFQALQVLLEGPGELVSREDLRRRLWPDGISVEFESGLNSAINRLRDVLCDHGNRPKYIETLPRRGYRFICPVLRVRAFEQPTVAVLPLESLSSEAEQVYFADGLTDALITELAHLSCLRVISRQSILQFKGSTGKMTEIGRALHADAIIEGTVFRAGSRFRITTQLVQVEPEHHLWAEAHEGGIEEALSMQARIARSVAEAVAVTLLPGEKARLERAAQVPPESQLAYMKARYHISRWTRESLEKAFAFLRQAIVLDPKHASAHAVLANALSLLAYWGHIPTRPAYEQARQLAARAIQLDDGLCIAHHAMAWSLWMNDWDLAGCEREVRLALKLSPSDAPAHMLYAVFLVTVRRDHEQALREARYGRALDPVSEFTNSGFAWITLFARRYEQAIEEARTTLEMFPHSIQSHYVLGLAHLSLGRHFEAIAALERAASISRDPVGLGYLGHACAVGGCPNRARELLDELTNSEYAAPKSLASLYAGLDRERAFEVLERALENRDPMLFWVDLMPTFEPLRDDPRWKAVLDCVPCSPGK